MVWVAHATRVLGFGVLAETNFVLHRAGQEKVRDDEDVIARHAGRVRYPERDDCYTISGYRPLTFHGEIKNTK